jgi:hypothetical protein
MYNDQLKRKGIVTAKVSRWTELFTQTRLKNRQQEVFPHLIDLALKWATIRRYARASNV